MIHNFKSIMIHSFRSMLVVAFVALVTLSMPTAALAQLTLTNQCDRFINTTVGTGVTLDPAWSDNNPAKSTQVPLPGVPGIENIGFRYPTSTGEVQEIMNVELNPAGVACTDFQSQLTNRNACIPAISENNVGACRIVFYKRNF